MYLNGQQSLVLQAVEFAGDGCCGNDVSYDPASCRLYDFYGGIYMGFRPALYVKL